MCFFSLTASHDNDDEKKKSIHLTTTLFSKFTIILHGRQNFRPRLCTFLFSYSELPKHPRRNSSALGRWSLSICSQIVSFDGISFEGTCDSVRGLEAFPSFLLFLHNETSSYNVGDVSWQCLEDSATSNFQRSINTLPPTQPLQLLL